MYRQLTRENGVPLHIYCVRGDFCDLSCGKFHQRKLRNNVNVRAFVAGIEAAAVEVNAKRKQRASNEEPVESNRPKLHLLTSSVSQDNSGGENLDPKSANLTLSLPSVSPAVSQASLASGTSVTLEDIIASARRKISEDYAEIRIPSPVFLDDDNTLWDKKAAKKRLIFHESSLDIPAMEGNDVGPQMRDLAHQYEDQESEAELVIQEEPPSYIGDDEAEDFEEMIKATKPPEDAFSNPILLRGADPLTTRKKRRAKEKQTNLLRQQSLTRLQMLESAAISNSSTPSAHTELDDGADNSSIDMSMAELSAAVAHSHHSGATSPATILQFIEEQKQRAAESGGTA